jgi:hypothetical protein
VLYIILYSFSHPPTFQKRFDIHPPILMSFSYPLTFENHH